MRLRGVRGCLLISVPLRMLERLSARALFRLPSRPGTRRPGQPRRRIAAKTTRHRSAAGSLNWVTAADVAASLPPAGPPTGRPQEGFFAHQLNPVSARNCSGPLTAAAVAHADDERMVKRAQDGDEAALTGLLIHYRPLVYGRARSYFLVGADHDDLAQEGMLGCAKPSVTSTAGRGVSPPSLRSVSIGRSCLRSGRHPDRSMGR